jgi:hypothetical protein
MKLFSIAIILGAAVAAAPSVVSAESLRANYLQEIDFFANPDRYDCYRVGDNSCSRLAHCGVENDNRGRFNACYELVNRCSDAGRTICENGAVELRNRNNLGRCEWSGGRNGSCIVAKDRRGNPTTVRIIQSSDAAPRPVNSLPR